MSGKGGKAQETPTHAERERERERERLFLIFSSLAHLLIPSL
jgi:hypothetical protein